MDTKKLIGTASLAVAFLTVYAGTPKQEIQKQYIALGKAFANKDASVFDSTMAKSFSLYDKPTKKTMTREQVMRDFKMQMSAMHNVSWKRKVLSIASSHGSYMVTVMGVFDGEFAMGPNTSKFHLLSKSQDTWKKVGSAWLIEKSTILTRDATINGKKVQSS